MALYKYSDIDGDRLAVFPANILGTYGVNIKTDREGCSLPDSEIPALISALQDYMSRRAKAITKAAKAAGE